MLVIATLKEIFPDKSAQAGFNSLRDRRYVSIRNEIARHIYLGDGLGPLFIDPFESKVLFIKLLHGDLLSNLLCLGKLMFRSFRYLVILKGSKWAGYILKRL